MAAVPIGLVARMDRWFSRLHGEIWTLDRKACPMNKDAGTTHLLVVADIWCQIDGLCAQVRSELDDRDPDVLVVAPPFTSRLSTFASDTDDETGAAKDRLADVLRRLKEHGVEARGLVGAHDPKLAIDDALGQFPAEKVLVVTDTADNENWREKDLPAYFEGLDIPSVRLIVPHDLAE